MNETLQELRDRIKPYVQLAITRIEESPLFERAVLKYEGLEPQAQQRLRSGAFLSAGLIVALAVLVPLGSSLSERSRVSRYQDLISSMKVYNTENEVVHRPAPKPAGWQPLDASSLEALKDSLTQFAAQTGISDDLMELVPQPPTELRISIKELSLRQALAFVFQIDGWNPAVRADQLHIAVHPESKDLLTFSAVLRFDPNAASNAGGAAPRSGPGEEGDVVEKPLPSSGPGAGAFGRGGNNNADGESPLQVPPGGIPGIPQQGVPVLPSFPDDFGGDLPPPPFEDDL